jgi:predicted AAA+ superfamily ATPase
VTGSSALRIGSGRDSLAGRISMLELGPLRLREIAELGNFGSLPPTDGNNGFSDWARPDFWHGLNATAQNCASTRDEAFARFAERGGYPMAHQAGLTWEEVADQLNETIIKRVIQHDLRIGERGRRRDEALLTELFGLAARQCGQAPAISTYVRDMQHALDASISQQRIRHYLSFLDDTLLIKLIQPLEIRNKRKRGAPKICLSDHALRAASLGERVPLTPEALAADPTMADIAGRISESIVGYFLSSLGVTVQHRVAKQNEPEVDFVLSLGDRRIPVEVKYQAQIDPIRDTAGLRSFMDVPHYRAPVGLLVTRNETKHLNFDPRIVAVSMRTLLLVR